MRRSVGLGFVIAALCAALGLTGAVMIGINLWEIDRAASGRIQYDFWRWLFAGSRVVLGLADLVAAYVAYMWLRDTVLLPLARLDDHMGKVWQASSLRMHYDGPIREIADLSDHFNKAARDFEEAATAREQGERRARVAYGALVKALEDTVSLNREVLGLNLELGAKTGQLEEALLQLQKAYDELKELKEVDRLKANFLNAISHELRTPLNFITGFASLLQDEVQGPLNEAQRHYIVKVLEGAEQLIGLIDDLLDYARMEAGHFALELQPTDLAPVVGAVVEDMTPLAREKGLALSTGELSAPPILADRGRVRQVLYNLVSNAIKFTPPGGRVAIAVRSDDSAVVLEVSDTGLGISQADLPNVFSKFFQAKVAETGTGNQVKGTGLGLAITKGLVEAHGGRIQVESEEGKGSTFRVFFPPMTAPSSSSRSFSSNPPSCSP